MDNNIFKILFKLKISEERKAENILRIISLNKSIFYEIRKYYSTIPTRIGLVLRPYEFLHLYNIIIDKKSDDCIFIGPRGSRRRLIIEKRGGAAVILYNEAMFRYTILKRQDITKLRKSKKLQEYIKKIDTSKIIKLDY